MYFIACFLSPDSAVDFASESDMRRAIKKLDGSELLGKRIRMVEVRNTLLYKMKIKAKRRFEMHFIHSFFVYFRRMQDLVDHPDDLDQDRDLFLLSARESK